MQREITVVAPCAGRVHKLMCAEGQAVAAGQALLVMSV
jgi:biotin carboxyl carrier protein